MARANIKAKRELQSLVQITSHPGTLVSSFVHQV